MFSEITGKIGTAHADPAYLKSSLTINGIPIYSDHDGTCWLVCVTSRHPEPRHRCHMKLSFPVKSAWGFAVERRRPPPAARSVHSVPQYRLEIMA
jgi:hypothetical protein